MGGRWRPAPGTRTIHIGAKPLDTRLYPSPEGDLARLTVDRVAGPGGELWWSVSLVREDRSPKLTGGQPVIEWHRTREEARRAYRERLAALRAEAWVQQV